MQLQRQRPLSVSTNDQKSGRLAHNLVTNVAANLICYAGWFFSSPGHKDPVKGTLGLFRKELTLLLKLDSFIPAYTVLAIVRSMILW